MGYEELMLYFGVGIIIFILLSVLYLCLVNYAFSITCVFFFILVSVILGLGKIGVELINLIEKNNK